MFNAQSLKLNELLFLVSPFGAPRHRFAVLRSSIRRSSASGDNRTAVLPLTAFSYTYVAIVLYFSKLARGTHLFYCDAVSIHENV